MMSAEYCQNTIINIRMALSQRATVTKSYFPLQAVHNMQNYPDEAFLYVRKQSLQAFGFDEM